MAYFIPSKVKGPILCYNGTIACVDSPAELTHPALIDKARRNPDFKEVKRVPKVEVNSRRAAALAGLASGAPKVTKKKASRKKKASKKASRKK